MARLDQARSQAEDGGLAQQEGEAGEPVAEEGGSAALSDDDLAACLRVLQRISVDRHLLECARLRPLRKALMGLLDEARERLPDKSSMDKNERKKHEKQMKRQRQQIKAEADKKWVDNAEIRRARLSALEKLQGDCQHAALLVPDGAARDAAPLALAGLPPAIAGGAATEEAGTAEPTNEPELVQPRACYTCHRRFTSLHHFYDRLCNPCADLNWQKRFQSVPLTKEFIALVTGARVKIGFEVAKKLLRCGATVIATSRFPKDTCSRFAALPDFSEFADRLHVYGLDFRSLPSVQRFSGHLSASCPHLDAVVHNACQTVRRPARYYRDIAQRELEPGQGPESRCLALQGSAAEESATADAPPPVLAVAGAALVGGSAVQSAAMSQLRVLEDDAHTFANEMPEGAVDVNGQQLDLREKHSWKLRLHEVSTEEMVECLCVNTITPFTLNSRLKELLLRSPRKHRFIVNVSAMEGKFYRTKTANHPHTNMAKAALNMMTRTSAQDYVSDGIYMNSVDTGWINDENPLPTAHRIAAEHNFQSPLDEVDAAARILDPIFAPISSGEEPVWGKFLKDYAETEW